MEENTETCSNSLYDNLNKHISVNSKENEQHASDNPSTNKCLLTNELSGCKEDGLLEDNEILDTQNITKNDKNLDNVSNEKFDRVKLIQAHKNVEMEIVQEMRKNAFLHKKIVEYFRRKNIARALEEDKLNTANELINNYRSYLLKLYENKSSFEALKSESRTKIQGLEDQKTQILNECSLKWEKFDNILKEVGFATLNSKSGQPLSDKVINMWFRKVSTLNRYVSEVRLDLIKAQDKITATAIEAKKFEDLGNGLKMIDFDLLRAEVQSLDDKIEERNKDLARLHNMCNSYNNALAHIREKHYILGSEILLKETIVSDIKNQQTLNRYSLNKLRLERDNLRKQYQKISFQSGLLDKPLLMYDYDETTEKVRLMSEKIEFLEEERRTLEEKLKNYNPS